MAAGNWRWFPHKQTQTVATQNTTITLQNTNVTNTGKPPWSYDGIKWHYTTDEPDREPIYDEFAVMVWEQRKAAGIEEPHPEPVGWKDPEITFAYPPGQQFTISSSPTYTFGFTGWASSTTNYSTSAQLTGQRSDSGK